MNHCHFDCSSIFFFSFWKFYLCFIRKEEAKDTTDYSDSYVANADTADFEYEVDDLSSQHDIESQNSSSGVDVST